MAKLTGSAKPLIGITPSSLDKQSVLQQDYAEWVSRSGGVPLMLPYSGGTTEDAAQLAAVLDGLLLSGGADIDPIHFGEEPIQGLGNITPERDAAELALIREFVRLDKPVFGICRGIQVLNAALGGTLYQDIHSQCSPSPLKHSQKAVASYPTHHIAIEAGSRLATLAGGLGERVNSFHHQAVKEAAPGLLITARTADGIVEAVESPTHRFVLGVQWHPEKMEAGDRLSAALFGAFVDACAWSGEQAVQ
ncbi:gamma-glutamyl-gamma-aminobutyrate hydrolase family protein [Paenibacillus koleovorans]|uniref:gamma-glutamyl-gamma-aminobutyrate hydrolase family protein n=1 Tax=Paenibacillus koleovorans TaxID=121608 RepID=UPI000FDBFF35|nr:gamma-glutamyl-gamma-aminobutyrate hydrolase family protein [Paenibacillus koleovorans]